MRNWATTLVLAGLLDACAWAQNHVAQLDGIDSHVELAPRLFADLSEATVEGWFKCDRLRPNRWFFDFGKPSLEMALGTGTNGMDLDYRIDTPEEHQVIAVTGILRPNQWFHFAAVSGKAGMQLYLNGVLVGSRPFTGSFAAIGNNENNRLGRDVWSGTDHAQMQLDEFRVWRVSRTEAEIRAGMFDPPAGHDPALVGAWNFEDASQSGAVSQHHRAQLMGHAQLIRSELPRKDSLIRPTVICGRLREATGLPAAGGMVRLEQAGRFISQAEVDESGSYRLAVLAAPVRYDLLGAVQDRGHWRLDLRLAEGEVRREDLTPVPDYLRGRVLALDNSPLNAVLVQLVNAEEPGPLPSSSLDRLQDPPPTQAIAAALTDIAGQFELPHVKPGRYLLRAHTLEGWVYFSHGQSFEFAHGQPRSDFALHLSPFRKGNWKRDRLVDGPVLSLGRAADGVLWIGTPAGAIRHNGREGLLLTADDGLGENHIWCLAEDSRRRMWFGTSGGVSIYDPTAGGPARKRFTRLTAQSGLDLAEVRCLYAAADGTMWLGGRSPRPGPGGLACYRQNQLRHFTPTNGWSGETVWGITGTPDGRIWLATSQGLIRYDGQEFVNVSDPDGGGSTPVTAVEVAPDGAVWFAASQELWRYDPTADGWNREALTHYGAQAGMLAGRINDLEFTPEGILWCATESHGAIRFDGQSFVYFPTQSGLADDRITAMFHEAEGTVWFGTRNGVARYERDGFRTWTVRDGLPSNDGSAVYVAADGKVWYGTMNGAVACYDGKTITRLIPAGKILENSAITCIREDARGTLWVAAGAAGVFYRSGERLLPLGGTNQVNVVLSIHGEPDGTLWFGGLDSVWRYEGARLLSYGPKEGFDLYRVLDIQQAADGAMLFAGQNGIVRYDGHRFRRYTTTDGLAIDHAQALHCDEAGRVWIGTRGGGVSQFDGQRFVTISTSQHRLADSDVRCIQPGSAEILWFGTTSGLTCYDGTAWASLGTRDGLPGRVVRSLSRGPDGALWLATDGGLVRYQRRRRSHPPPALTVQTDRWYKDLSAIPPIRAGTPVKFQLHANDWTTRPGDQQYRYCVWPASPPAALTHPNVAWSVPTRQSDLEWAAEKPGAYTLAFQYIDRDLNYSAPAFAKIVLVPAWYLNARIMLPVGAGAALVLALAGSLWCSCARRRLETQRLRDQLTHEERALADGQAFTRLLIASQEQERKRIAQELHDSLGQDLLVIRNLALLGAATPSITPITLDKYEQISDLAEKAVREVRQISYGLRPEELDRLGLTQALVAMVNEAAHSTATRFEHDIDPLAQLLPPEHEINLYRVVQEGINNILKHAQANRVRVSVKCRDRMIVLTLQDDGRGFQPEAHSPGHSARPGFGLSGMRGRVRILGGELRIASAPGAGTVVQAFLPLSVEPQRPSAPPKPPPYDNQQDLRHDRPHGTWRKSRQPTHPLRR